MQVDDQHLYLKCHSSTVVLKHFASKNQLPGLSVSGTLVGKKKDLIVNVKKIKLSASSVLKWLCGDT